MYLTVTQKGERMSSDAQDGELAPEWLRAVNLLSARIHALHERIGKVQRDFDALTEAFEHHKTQHPGVRNQNHELI